MSISTSILDELLKALPNWRGQMYFKSSLTALARALEDQVLAGSDTPLVIASFQHSRLYRQEIHRYIQIGNKSSQVYVLSQADLDFRHHSGAYETIAFEPSDFLSQEWHFVVIGSLYTASLISQEKSAPMVKNLGTAVDSSRRFEGIWTFDRQVAYQAADLLLQRILLYRPELKAKVKEAYRQHLDPLQKKLQQMAKAQRLPIGSPADNPDPFVQRLVTYLQAGQYKFLKTYRSLAAKEERERLMGSITVAIRRSLNPEEILQVAVEKLGEAMAVSRCLVYRCKETDTEATLNHEFIQPGIHSLQGEVWSLQDNPFFQAISQHQESLYIKNVFDNAETTTYFPSKAAQKSFQKGLKSTGIQSLLMVPVLYQGHLLGMVELHQCQISDQNSSGVVASEWTTEEINLVEAIATQVGVALIQAEAYANLEDLNQQLEALDRTRSNLVAITGHELRTPLSTIQVCLESLASEPDMEPELRQVMLTTALEDAERMRKLVQDFLTLSQFESGRVQWNPEPISLVECVELALSSVRIRNPNYVKLKIENTVEMDVPLVQADGEWLVEVLGKLLDNACKFTDVKGKIVIQTTQNSSQMLEVTISDTGRGIEKNRLEKVFDRFYQEEGALRRTAGGTGLGLAICRQIVSRWGGKIWAESQGKEHGSQFHFTVPVV